MGETPEVPDGEETPEMSLADLLAYRKALEQEFDIEAKPELVDPDVLAEAIKRRMVQHLPKAFQTLAHLSEHAESESVRLNASKLILEATMGSKAYASPGDPWEGLLKKLAPDRIDVGSSMRKVDPEDLPEKSG